MCFKCHSRNNISEKGGSVKFLWHSASGFYKAQSRVCFAVYLEYNDFLAVSWRGEIPFIGELKIHLSKEIQVSTAITFA